MKDHEARCIECGCLVPPEQVVQVDGVCVCRHCLHGDVEPILVYPIGYVHNDLDRGDGGLRTVGKSQVSRIELLPAMQRFMKGLEHEEYITIIYCLHKAESIKTSFRRGWDGREVGIFASRSPDRVNPLAITTVKLLRVEGTTLYVEGLDAINGSPVLDIKMGGESVTPRDRDAAQQARAQGR